LTGARMNETTDQPTENKLVERAQNGCIDSFGALYRRHFGSMVALAYSATGNICVAEDAAQETFAIACRDLSKLKSKDKFAAWLAGICRRGQTDEQAKNSSRCATPASFKTTARTKFIQRRYQADCLAAWPA